MGWEGAKNWKENGVRKKGKKDEEEKVNGRKGRQVMGEGTGLVLVHFNSETSAAMVVLWLWCI